MGFRNDLLPYSPILAQFDTAGPYPPAVAPTASVGNTPNCTWSGWSAPRQMLASLRVDIGCWASTSSQIGFRMLLDGTPLAGPQNSEKFYFNQTNTHLRLSFEIINISIPPGTHTFQLQWQAGGTINFDLYDCCTMTLRA